MQHYEFSQPADRSVTGGSNVYKVSELSGLVRQLLEENFPDIVVEAEIGDFTAARSGHWYMTLKDESSQLRCVIFKRENLRLFKPKTGDIVHVRGRLSLYAGRGSFQLIGNDLVRAGDGALQRAFEQLKKRLSAEGLFETGRKRPLPQPPHHLAVITSREGAALQDVLKVLSQRCPLLPITVVPVPVQGDQAAPAIIEALQRVNSCRRHPKIDLILLTRGGGSAEDLWSFNDEGLVRAVVGSKLPVICAIGHEIDFTLAEFAADQRAATPSAAAEMLSPDTTQLLEDNAALLGYMQRLLREKIGNLRNNTDLTVRRLRTPKQLIEYRMQRSDELVDQLHNQLQRIVITNRQMLTQTGKRLRDPSTLIKYRQQRNEAFFRGLFQAMGLQLAKTRHEYELLCHKLNSPEEKIQHQALLAEQLCDRLKKSIYTLLAKLNNQLEKHQLVVTAHDPQNILARGYSLLSDHNDRLITNSAMAPAGSTVRAQLARGKLVLTVDEQHPESSDNQPQSTDITGR